MITTPLDTVKIRLDTEYGTSLMATTQKGYGATHLGATPLGWIKLSSEAIKSSIDLGYIDKFLLQAFQAEGPSLYSEVLAKVKKKKRYSGNYVWMEVDSSLIKKPEQTPTLIETDHLELTYSGVIALLEKALSVLESERHCKKAQSLVRQLLTEAFHRMEFTSDLEALCFYSGLIRAKKRHENALRQKSRKRDRLSTT